ncbi:Formyl-coenzyme A transferase [Pigmentiphaga humi]|uniref:Formyl-coenzyme A transferase n=1 Tax=Pigmentiphaga humi TaxID=2478468 RepID=A0A3P4AZF9_9BURK|nr:CoA transferase [Pigmentiphaga humi]VCU69427.1 Formyl-coenzyme A transferase [Pigmentiphaga humi]
MAHADTQRGGPLAGIKVLDLTWVILGPFCTQLLADHGAEVIKLEAPDGDPMRSVGPRRTNDMGPSFLQLNRNKRSLTLDLKQEASSRVLERLIGWCDVFVSNMRPQALERLGLDYERVRRINPGAIYVSCSGFGEDGPYAGRPAFDEVIQAMTGLAAARARDGDGMPQSCPFPLADRYTGLYAAFCISTALAARARDGVGQKLEIPMFEVLSQLVLGDHMIGSLFQPPQSAPGYDRYLNGLRTYFRTADGHLCAAINTDRQWRKFLEAAGRPELLDHPSFATRAARARDAQAVDRQLRELFEGDTTAHWLALLERAEVPAAPVRGIADLLDDPHLQSVGFFLSAPHPTEGELRMPGFPARWSATPPSYRRPAPTLGQHTEEILRELGL